MTLRQLCQLGLPATLLLPALLPVLRQVVPAAHAGFFFCDAHGGIVNLYAERLLPPRVMAAYHDKHDDDHFRQHYLQRLAAPSPTSRRSLSPADKGSDYYREVLQPLGIEHFLYAIVRDGPSVLGQLSLYRGPEAAPFGDADEQQLQGVLHYLGRALAVPTPSTQAELAPQTLEEGLALLDPQGHELLADAAWQRLLRMAHGDAIAPAAALAEHDTLPRFAAEVLQAVAAAADGEYVVHTGWGRFAFRCHVLTGRDGSAATALRLSRQSAAPLRLVLGAAALGLTPQQREVAVLVAQGYGNAEIAQQLGIKPNTADFHVKQVFARLGVHERSAVEKALLAAAAGQPLA